MRELDSIAKSRKVPCCMVLDSDGTVLYVNEAVDGVIPLVPKEAGNGGTDRGAVVVPEEIRRLFVGKVEAGPEVFPATVSIICSQGIVYAVQVFPIMRPEDPDDSLFMLMAQPVVEHRHVNFSAIKDEFNLSKKELQVLESICHGLSNREIGDKLFISEYTVKDHVKNLMQKFGASSRTEVLSLLNGR